ncbi:hypothetical protein B0J17DRAFT_708867 [Rhizoctonia solani]|nr:hypothetical protein B0J17DRAFT_708867 [Rhizoctonia solani]
MQLIECNETQAPSGEAPLVLVTSRGKSRVMDTLIPHTTGDTGIMDQVITIMASIRLIFTTITATIIVIITIRHLRHRSKGRNLSYQPMSQVRSHSHTGVIPGICQKGWVRMDEEECITGATVCILVLMEVVEATLGGECHMGQGVVECAGTAEVELIARIHQKVKVQDLLAVTRRPSASNTR